jgi:putative transposase
MTEIIDAMPNPSGMDQQQFAQAVVAQARSEGVELVGPGGLLTGLTKSVLENALEAELTERRRYQHYDAAGRDGGNSPNRHRTKTVFTPR